MNDIVNETLPGIAAKFGTCPEVAQQGAFILSREGSHLSEVERDDWIAVDGRWRQVTLCTQVQGEVTLSFGPGAADVSAPSDSRVFLARVISCRTVATHRARAHDALRKVVTA